MQSACKARDRAANRISAVSLNGCFCLSMQWRALRRMWICGDFVGALGHQHRLHARLVSCGHYCQRSGCRRQIHRQITKARVK